MIKKYRSLILVTSLVTVLPILIGLLFWNRLPAMMATHFGVSGEANGYSGKAVAVFFIPLFVLAMHLICVCATLLDPKKKEISDKMLYLVFWICPVTSWFCAILVYSNALGMNLDVMTAVDIFMAVLFIGIGNYLPKCRQNYTVGIKLPWTLDDPENWNKTHRLGGRLFVLAGLVCLVDIFLRIFWLPLAAICLASLIPCIYSVVLYQRKKKE
ncbi:MAG: SdpI family protein [Lachnospiraceae bacterium]|nr:SdpI family protein [Lachnospiraceae bacterium]